MADRTAKSPQLLAVALVQDAKAYALGAQTLASVHAIGVTTAPTYFLLGQAVELVLKAHLSASGVSKTTLKDIGHHIDVLFQKARDDFGFVPTDDRFPVIVEWLAPHHRDHLFRYRKAVGNAEFPIKSEAAEIIINTIDGVELFVRQQL